MFQSDSRLVIPNLKQLLFTAQDHFAIVNNSYYSLTCVYLDLKVILCNTIPVLFIFFELATRGTLNTRIENTDNFIYIKVLNMMH